jgi:hypothetical protein
MVIAWPVRYHAWSEIADQPGYLVRLTRALHCLVQRNAAVAWTDISSCDSSSVRLVMKRPDRSALHS